MHFKIKVLYILSVFTFYQFGSSLRTGLFSTGCNFSFSNNSKFKAGGRLQVSSLMDINGKKINYNYLIARCDRD